jgi:hypothetical protein
MKRVKETFLKTQIRSVDPRDFAFIRSLAAEFPRFTVPAEYILWFFARFHPQYCRVLEQKTGALKAYLLAMPTSDPANGIAIWQIAAAKPNQAFALEYFAAYLRELVDHTGATSISFTSSLDPATLRLIRLLASEFFGSDVVQLSSVPTGQGEYEFRLSAKLPRD